MTTIRLLDARRGLNLKCRELFQDEKIAEEIYRFLCDGIEECEDAEPERKKGRWVRKKDKKTNAWWHSCSECGARPLKTLFGQYDALSVYCPNCGAEMEGAEE